MPVRLRHSLVSASLALPLMVGSVPPASAGEASVREAMERLGALNGIALHCNDIERLHAIKQAILNGTPRIRSHGAAFEAATQDAYLEAVRTAAPCPDKAAFDARIDKALNFLKTSISEN